MNDDGYGPGVGTLIGLKLGLVHARSTQQTKALDEARAQLHAKAVTVLHNEALALAAADVMAAVLAELQSGKRRLSDPDAVAERNDFYAQRAATHVRKMTRGRVRLAQADVERIAAERPVN